MLFYIEIEDEGGKVVPKSLKILCIHGLGDHRNSTWQTTWPKAVRSVFPAETSDIELEFDFLTYDDIFEDTKISFYEAVKAAGKLALSGLGSIGRKRGLLDKASEKIKWTAGYVVAWLEDDQFQNQTRKRVLKKIVDYEPDIIVAHSLGSMICYCAFQHKDAEDNDIKSALKKAQFVSIGSQLANPFVVRNVSPGRLQPLPTKSWRHFYNKHDDVFTAPIRLYDQYDFRQIETHFDIPGDIADHSAERYLSHENAIEEFWRPIAEGLLNPRAFGPASRALSKAARKKILSNRPASKRKRALLIGINEYPNEQDKLAGCVNDVFQISAVLQECGFEADGIRTCLDDRATRNGILERFEWLMDDPQPGDERIFYFAGHGAQIPSYGFDMEPDHYEEILVPYDFDWSPETAITDDDLISMYSQLPYDTRFGMIFDCCHGGGDYRDGGPSIRGISPPDDIRHRELKWDAETEMWVPRDFARMDTHFGGTKSKRAQFYGTNGCTARLGRATSLRGVSRAKYTRLKREAGGKPIGPYMPLVLQACDESELASEYRHGVTSYGAFTYSITTLLRRLASQKAVSYVDLLESTKDQLEELGYDQVPQITGPKAIVNEKVPWLVRS